MGSEPVIIAILTVIASSLFAMYMSNRKTQREDSAEINRKLDSLTTKVEGLEVKIQPFWASLQSKLSDWK